MQDEFTIGSDDRSLFKLDDLILKVDFTLDFIGRHDLDLVAFFGIFADHGSYVFAFIHTFQDLKKVCYSSRISSKLLYFKMTNGCHSSEAL